MRYLLYTSLLLLFCIAWHNGNAQSLTAKQKEYIPQLSDSAKMYSANFTVYRYHFTGLIYFIKQNDSTVRAIMTSEMGPKILDLNLMPQKYNVNFAVRQMRRKVVLNTFYYDLGVISGLFTCKQPTAFEANDSTCRARYNLSKKKELLFSFDDLHTNKSVVYIYEKKKEMVKVEFFYLQGSSNIDSVSLKHLNTKMNIELKKVKL